jgi:hypothetical protein
MALLKRGFLLVCGRGGVLLPQRWCPCNNATLPGEEVAFPRGKVMGRAGNFFTLARVILLPGPQSERGETGVSMQVYV